MSRNYCQKCDDRLAEICLCCHTLALETAVDPLKERLEEVLSAAAHYEQAWRDAHAAAISARASAAADLVRPAAGGATCCPQCGAKEVDSYHTTVHDTATTKLLDLIKQKPYLLSLALTEYQEELDSALYDYPDEPDVEQWKEDSAYLDEVIGELGLLVETKS